MPLDPLADLCIFVWPKIPMLLLSLPLTDKWGPSVSFSFNLLPPLYHALHTSTPPLPPSACSPPGGLISFLVRYGVGEEAAEVESVHY